MRPFTTVPRPLLLALAVLFGAATTAYSITWMVHVHHVVGLGTDVRWVPSHEAEVHDVEVGSSPWQQGLRPGDRIVAVNGEKLDNPSPFYGYPFYKAVTLGRKGDVVQLSVLPPGETGEHTIRATLIAYSSPVGLRGLAAQAMNFYPLFFLVVGTLVLSLRLEDRHAWLLALLFAGFICGAPLFEGPISPHLRGLTAWYKMTFDYLTPGIFCYFFLTFPTPSPIDRHLPRLKGVLLSLTIAYSIGLGFACLVEGGLSPLYSIFGWVSWKPLAWPFMLYTLVLYGLGFVSLVWNSVRPATVDVRRKTRVILWGILVGFGPLFVIVTASFLTNFPIWEVPFWVLALAVISLSLMPLSFAYAVAKHRVLEIPVLLKRSARYVLVQRGYILLLFGVAVTAIAVFTHTISRFFPAGTNLGMAFSAAFGIVLVWASAPVVKRGTDRIDRFFFRSAYDARVILQELAEKTRMAVDRHELAKLLEIQIEGALHPKSLACYLQGGEGNLVIEGRSAPGEPAINPAALRRPRFPFRFGAVFIPREMDAIPTTLPLLADIAQRGKAWDVPQSPEALSAGPLAAECLVPILGRNSTLIGLLVLGPRFSEEPYSTEDKRLLDSVASQAGITLENIDFAEKMAERMEAERKAAMEIDIARRVQARLFPQSLPPLKTLEYVGGCVQARQVGGDYYDFLDMGPGVVGIVLADISGKGMSGALLMANLQANLRSQYAVARDDLPRLLQSVNRLFCENTTDDSYATMFFGVYDDSCRSLRFANCGHVAPLLLRGDGSMQFLVSTTTVLGLFLKWESSIEEVKLHPGDILVICTDGVTEAPNTQGEEYGEERLARLIQENRDLPVNDLLATIQSSAQQFSGVTQADDITLIVARCH